LAAFVIIVAGAFFAALLRRLTGFGFAMIAAPVLSLGLPPQSMVVTVLLLQIFLGIPAAIEFHKLVNWSVLGILLAGGVAGAPLGTLLLRVAPEPIMLMLIGLLICGSAVLQQFRQAKTTNASRSGYLVVGVLSAMLGSAFALPGPPLAIYFAKCADISLEQQRAMLINTFTLVALLAFIPAYFTDLVTWEITLRAVALIPVLFLGGYVGERIYRRLPQTSVQKLGLFVIFMAGSICFVRGISALAA